MIYIGRFELSEKNILISAQSIFTALQNGLDCKIFHSNNIDI